MPDIPDLYVLGVIAGDLRELVRLADESGLEVLAGRLRAALAEAEAEIRRRRP